MAGSYPDSPSWRMAYDRDGTQVFSVSGATVTQRSQSDIVTLNKDNIGDRVSWTTDTVFLFPELRDIDAAYVNQDWDNKPVAMWTSTDTTNGVDGTWTSQGTVANGLYNAVAWRTLITPKAITAVRAVKIQGYSWMQRVHLYGKPSSGQNLHRLALWHLTTDNRVGPAHFDWGNVQRGSTADRQFRVKNLSPDKTAQSIRVAMDSTTNTTPSVPGQHSLSLDGNAFFTELNIGNLAPGAISQPITLRRVTPTNAVLSIWAFRVFAESSSWV